MPIIGRRVSYVLKHPGAFTMRTLRGFRANQGLLLAGAVAYYSLLSLIPLLILVVIVLSQVLDEAELMFTLGRYLEWLAPGQSASLILELSAFLEHRNVVGWILLATMLFFSSLAFTVLENAMSVIFHHRVAIRRRRFLVSAILPYCYILCLGVGLLIVTVVSNDLQRFGEQSVSIFGQSRSLGQVSGVLLYLLGLAGEVFVLTSVYMVMPVGRLSLKVALAGGITAALLWEISRHILVWYFATLSQVNLVYGSLTTAIMVMISLEIAATFLLLGAQVISEYERLGKVSRDHKPKPMHTD